MTALATTKCASNRPLRLLLVTDAWAPQVNGVSRTYQWLATKLRERTQLHVLSPDGFPSVGLPTYPDIRLAVSTPARIARQIERIGPQVVHIATEGPLGWLARAWCRKTGLPFTTCYHTRFPEYVSSRFPIPAAWIYPLFRRFHAPAARTMVATDQLVEELGARGFSHLARWRRGIDVAAFRDGPLEPLELPRPVFLYVGRLAVEKNIDGFLNLELPGSKLVVGDGPERTRLQKQYPQARFLGAIQGPRLGAIYRAADALVFPSLTDTFGLVMAEALAAGTPVAAFPVGGARTIFSGMECGVLDNDLRKAALAALDISRDVCRAAGQLHSMQESAASFLKIVRSAAGR